MRIGVLCYPTYGGSGVVASELAMQLAERGHELHVISHDRPFRIERWQPNLVSHTVEVESYPLFKHAPYDLHLINKIVEVVLEHNLEIIHSHYAIPHAYAAWTAREVLRHEHGRDLRLACTLHGTDITLVGRDPGFHALTRFAIGQQDLLTAPSAWLARETESAFGIPTSRIQVIPNFVDLERFCPGPGLRCKQVVVPGKRTIVHVSNFRPVKRVDEVVRAFARLRKEMPATLVLVGDGPELPNAERQARELGIRDDLRILGKMTEVELILQVADLFLLPSRAESFGLAALEAMACGAPVLGYHAGGLPEVVEDGVSGILAQEGCDVCLGSLAAQVLRDDTRYQAMRQAARARAEQFALAPIVNCYEQAMRNLIHLETASN